MSRTGRAKEVGSLMTTGNVARQFLGNALNLLNSAYNVTDSYEVVGLGSTPANANRENLDGIRIRAESDFKALPATDDPLDAKTQNQVGFDIASIESATDMTIDVLGQNTALGDLLDSVTDAGADIIKKAGDLPRGAADLIPWWVWAILAGGVVLVLVMKTKR